MYNLGIYPLVALCFVAGGLAFASLYCLFYEADLAEEAEAWDRWIDQWC